MRRPIRNRSAFTLIELLCVCAILLLLAVLLLPVIDSAQDRALTGACISNERQIGVAWHQYSGENGGVAIGCNWQAQSGQPDESPFVFNALYPYGISWSIWRCPASPQEYHNYGAWPVGTYGISFPQFTRGGPSWTDQVRMSEINNPATTAFLADKLFAFPPNLYTSYTMAGHAWAGMNAGGQDAPWPLHGPWYTTGIKTRTNVIRVDGSVRTYEYSEIIANRGSGWAAALYGQPPHYGVVFWDEAARHYLWSGVAPRNTNSLTNAQIRPIGWLTE